MTVLFEEGKHNATREANSMDRKNYRIATLEVMNPCLPKSELAEAAGLSRSQLWRRMKSSEYREARTDLEGQLRELSIEACRLGLERLLELIGSDCERISLEASRSAVLLHTSRLKKETRDPVLHQTLPTVTEALEILQNDLK